MLKRCSNDTHVIIRNVSEAASNTVHIIPILNDERCSEQDTSRYTCVPVSSFRKNNRMIGLGLETSQNEYGKTEHKLYFKTDSVPIPTQHKWGYETTVSNINETKNFCKLKFGCTGFIFVAGVSNIDDNVLVISKLHELLRYL